MFGIRFMKAAPTTYVMQFKRGRVRREGPGLSFLYYAPTSTIVAVPLASADVPFAFSEATADFQPITVQGQLSYRVVEPARLASLLDHSILPSGKHRSDDPHLCAARRVHAPELLVTAVGEQRPLRAALTSSSALVADVLPRLRSADAVQLMGVEVLELSVLSVKPTPEMSRALEAEAREELQRKADEALYARRNAAVDQERRIKENELCTEVAVEEKRRQIRETQMAAEIAVEQQRAKLIEQRVENERKDADGKAYALEAVLKPLAGVDWRTLSTVAAGGGDPRTMIAMAFRELAGNAGHIGQLNVTPDLLGSLLGPARK